MSAQPSVSAGQPAPGAAHRVLLAESDDETAEGLTHSLEQDGFEVARIADGRLVLATAGRVQPDLLILDVSLPDLDNRQICAELRRASRLPVIILAAPAGADERIAGFEAGADDYVTKPFSPRELVLRVHSILRRGAPAQREAPARMLGDGDLNVDTEARLAYRNGRPLRLAAREYALLAYFLARPSCVVTRQRLLAEVWNWSFGDDTTVTVHIRRLREKIESDPANPRRLITVWGAGYRYEPADPTEA